MPIKKENYPPNWKEFSLEIRVNRAGGRCECRGECGADHTHPNDTYAPGRNPGVISSRCTALNGQLGFCFRHNSGECGHLRVVVLTVAHLWQHGCTCEPVRCANPGHVKAMCQRCHLRYLRHQR
jgi:hypothetical protein